MTRLYDPRTAEIMDVLGPLTDLQYAELAVACASRAGLDATDQLSLAGQLACAIAARGEGEYPGRPGLAPDDVTIGGVASRPQRIAALVRELADARDELEAARRDALLSRADVARCKLATGHDPHLQMACAAAVDGAGTQRLAAIAVVVEWLVADSLVQESL